MHDLFACKMYVSKKLSFVFHKSNNRVKSELSVISGVDFLELFELADFFCILELYRLFQYIIQSNFFFDIKYLPRLCLKSLFEKKEKKKYASKLGYIWISHVENISSRWKQSDRSTKKVCGASQQSREKIIRKRGVRFLPLLGVDIYIFSTTWFRYSCKVELSEFLIGLVAGEYHKFTWNVPIIKIEPLNKGETVTFLYLFF